MQLQKKLCIFTTENEFIMQTEKELGKELCDPFGF